ncbi:uncharacterized protein LOC127389798 isoform X2 [Apus apus]|uniref:uncharacterized protein LOC127389798 isoform X2 n=1 Tax=Apus apus TaxID=8895 RepID=UPI0021F887B8|nr:uncharacterized protein LOC127389798 isoform X2 [Apus apus]
MSACGGSQTPAGPTVPRTRWSGAIVGPPTLSWLLQGHNLSVNLTMPLTPYPCTNGSHEPVDQVLQKLRYWLQLYEGDLLVQVVPCRWRGEKEPCTFGPLKPSTHYCVRTVAVEMATQSREAEQCVVTPPDPAGFPWFLLVLLSAVLPLLILAGFCSIHLQVLPSPSEMHLPETLQGLQNRELSKTMGVPALELKEDSLSLLLPPMSPSHGLPVAEQGVPAVRLLLRGSLPQDVSGYCANGFGPGCCEGQQPSCTLGRPGHAFSYQISSQLEEDEEADEDNVLEQLVSVGQGRDSYTGDGDYGISETLLSQHLQLYSKCQCPALGAGSCLPLPAPGRSFSQEDLQESLGVPGHGVQLSSVKLHASEEEDGRQLIHALQPLWTELQPGDSTVQPGSPEPTAPGIPCQLPHLPSKALQAAAFSGYELRPRADGEP